MVNNIWMTPRAKLYTLCLTTRKHNSFMSSTILACTKSISCCGKLTTNSTYYSKGAQFCAPRYVLHVLKSDDYTTCKTRVYRRKSKFCPSTQPGPGWTGLHDWSCETVNNVCSTRSTKTSVPNCKRRALMSHIGNYSYC